MNGLKGEKEALRSVPLNRVETVLDALVFHPALHVHVPPLDHGIRISHATTNPFLFLFHLRYQLCPDDGARARERRRLVDLFVKAAKGRETLPPANLFAQ